MIFRRIEVPAVRYTASTLVTRELPKTLYKGLQLQLEVTHTNAGSGVAITQETLCKLIDKISIVINGQDHIIKLKFYQLFYMIGYLTAITPVSDIFTTTSTQGTSRISLYLPFALFRAVRPEDTLLDARNASTIDLHVEWGNSIGAGVTSIDSASLKIYTKEYANAGANIASGVHRFSYVTESLTATGQKDCNLETGEGNQYSRLWLFALNNSGALSDVQFDTVGVKSRDTYYTKISADALKKMNCHDYNYAPKTGVYIIDFTTDGKMIQRLDATNLSELKLELNSLVSNGTVEVVREKVVYATK